MPAASLSDHVHEQILELIAREGLEPHTRLPSEMELGERCGASRPVVRQALARLRADGRVYARQGAGNFVGEQPPLSDITFGSLQNIADIRALLDFRCVLEGETAARAAQCQDRHLLHAITAKRRLFDAALAQGRPAIDEDIAFHRAIAEAGGNRFFVLTMAALEEQFRYAVRLVRELSPLPKRDRARDVREEHRAIDEAIAAGDPKAAREAMNRHLRGGMARLFGS
ncbi:FadR family transcriptional regulator [Ramlibacter sp. G-1-2-2]|uniref:FadR family transcriptional regulator n=1 Tax=Ramlibacter agri TaxID=2728837 RepID=A0A848HIL6_9BURK|nr:FadR/GntR family transcriptional regulator [Ramlibacter agri]NML47558.1 FadR family transcriptional regulator [Ramlibacter agri]